MADNWDRIVGPLFDSYILLLQDDEPHIRNSLPVLVHRDSENELQQVVSTKTLDLVLECLVDAWLRIKPLHCLAYLLNLALRTDHNSNTENSNIQEGDEQPFDKGELNVFAEEISMTKLACKQINRALGTASGKLNASATIPLLPWISQEQVAINGSTTLSSFLLKCTGFLDSLSRKISECGVESLFMCHLFDSLCIQIFQYVQVLNCFLNRKEYTEMVEPSVFNGIILNLKSWPHKNIFLEEIVNIVYSLLNYTQEL